MKPWTRLVAGWNVEVEQESQELSEGLSALRLVVTRRSHGKHWRGECGVFFHDSKVWVARVAREHMGAVGNDELFFNQCLL